MSCSIKKISELSLMTRCELEVEIAYLKSGVCRDFVHVGILSLFLYSEPKRGSGKSGVFIPVERWASTYDLSDSLISEIERSSDFDVLVSDGLITLAYKNTDFSIPSPDYLSGVAMAYIMFKQQDIINSKEAIPIDG